MTSRKAFFFICCLFALSLLAGSVESQVQHQPLSLEILPAQAIIKNDDCVQFTVLVHTNLNTVYTPDRIRWSATGGVIGNEGKYTAPTQAGTYRITARMRHMQATAQVEVKVFQPPIARVAVNPPSVSLEIGQSYQFQAIAYDTMNRPVQFVPVWTVTMGGSVSNTGMFSATRPGQFVVTARDAQSNIAGNATVVVRQPSPVPVRIQINPPSARMRSGQAALFSAIVYDNYNRPIPCMVIWSASGGQINSQGTYTAGYMPGTYQVVATEPTSGIQGMCSVQIVGHPQPPNPPNPPSNGRIVVTNWDVGHGNWLTPKAKVTVQVFGSTAATVRMYSVSSTGGLNEMDAAGCSDGAEVQLKSEYNRGSISAIEIRLYDNANNLLANVRRNID
jgi:hypothetical protein